MLPNLPSVPLSKDATEFAAAEFATEFHNTSEVVSYGAIPLSGELWSLWIWFTDPRGHYRDCAFTQSPDPKFGIFQHTNFRYCNPTVVRYSHGKIM